MLMLGTPLKAHGAVAKLGTSSPLSKIRVIPLPPGGVEGGLQRVGRRSRKPPWDHALSSPHISQVSRCGGWVRAGGWFRTWPARVPAAVGGWAGSTMVSLVAGLVESRSQAAAALRNRA